MSGEHDSSPAMGDSVIQEALTSGTDLREYSHKLEKRLKRVSLSSILHLCYSLLGPQEP